MGTIVRRVPKNWKHPIKNGEYIPLHDGLEFSEKIAEWDEGFRKWNEGFRKDFHIVNAWVSLSKEEKGVTYASWSGERPSEKDYAPLWSDEECTCFMLYEDISEGTPLSPIFPTIEELNSWIENRKITYNPLLSGFNDKST